MGMNIAFEGSFLIARIHQISGRIFEAILRRYGLSEITPAKGRILFALWKNDAIPIQELARQTSLSKSTLTSMIDRLEQQGFLVRVHSDKDRREILIRLTEKDRSLQDTYTKVSQEMMDIGLAGFNENETRDLEDKLRRILANLVEYEQKIKRTAQ
jgi:MarR family transcriptional regulator, organic hydroperoxide resistance regulator